MTVRTSPRVGRALCCAMGGLLIAGCDQVGALHDPANAAEPVLSQAIDDLADADLLSYSATAFAGGDAEFATSAGGASFGTVDATGANVDILAVDGNEFRRANADYWEGEGVEEDNEHGDTYAELVDSDWVLNTVDPALAESSMTPAQYADRLRDAIEGMHGYDRWLPEASTINGVAQYQIYFETGSITVTATEPYRVLRVSGVPIAAGGDSIPFDVAPMKDVDAESWRHGLDAAVDDMSTVHEYGAATSMSTSSDGFACDGPDCTFQAELGTEGLDTDRDWLGDKVTARFIGTGRTAKYGTEECLAEKKITIGKSATAKCTVHFDINDGGGDDVTTTWYNGSVATYHPDPDDLKSMVDG